MALVKFKPTSPGRRAVVQVVNAHLYKGKPLAALVESKSKNADRNNNGHITVRHQGGGHKQAYRLIDFKRNKDGIPAKVERDPEASPRVRQLIPTILPVGWRAHFGLWSRSAHQRRLVGSCA